MMSGSELTETLEGLRFFQDMPPQHLQLIAKVAQLQDCGENEVVFREGDPADHMYVVVSGLVSLEICAPGVGCQQILTLGPGELLGWSALLEGRFTARARTPHGARLLQINVAELMKICDRDPQFGYELMRRTALALAHRLSATRMQLLNVYGEHLPVVAQNLEAGNGQ